jgi:TRAP transporter TAXI family solute receptor
MFFEPMKKFVIGATLIASTVAAAQAETVVLAGNPPGSLFNSMSNAIAATVTKHSGLKVDVLPQGGTVYYPMMATKEVDFGLVNPFDAFSAYKGKAPYDRVSRGKGFPMRTVMLGSPIRLSIVTTKRAGISSIADLKGKRVVANYGAFASAGLTANAALAIGGLTIDDVRVVTVSSYPAGVRAVIEGRADAAVGSIGSGIIRELDAAKGAKMIPLSNSVEALERARKFGGAWQFVTVKPGLPGVEAEMTALSYEIPIVARETLSDDAVYEFTRTVWKHHKELRGIFKPLATWTPNRYASTKAIIPYHSGAIRFYQEQGVWTPELEKHQAASLAK